MVCQARVRSENLVQQSQVLSRSQPHLSSDPKLLEQVGQVLESRFLGEAGERDVGSPPSGLDLAPHQLVPPFLERTRDAGA
jgi:hypothetical protein